jgi:tRNA/tmRNA/rRNA uracil-C5-methylase (TrmA/RlmC/RlmD family)
MYLPDGNIECLGRMDDQVKIRGYRIELGEIETILQKSELVNQAVVLAKENNENNNSLISYYIPQWNAVKEKEKELYVTQVASWKEIYETEYAKSKETSDEEFDINIWNDSFTGDPIPEDQMHEWVQDIADEILSENPENVLEIGCGTGLIYYPIAEKIKKYIGTDFSQSSINQISKRVDKKLRDYCQTELKGLRSA